jgi:large subunit ribosomal protein L2
MTGILYREVLTRTEPEKSLVKGYKRHVGRNSAGRITVRHKGSGVKRLFRDVDFIYEKKDLPAKIVSIEYDPNRSAFIALAVYPDGVKRYVVIPEGMKVGTKIVTSAKADVLPGNRLPLLNIPVGTQIYNIEVKPNGGAKLVRSAGSGAFVLGHDAGMSQIKMPSGEVRKVSATCWATIGQVCNSEHNLVTIGKAGRSRWLGIRPTVRGSAMNPCDHPYGGGEGRQLRGTRRPKNLWGKGTRGVKTRRAKKYSNYSIVQRRKK